MSDQTTTLAAIIEAATEEGTWVNTAFEAVVRNAKAAEGRKPSKADLCDPDSPNIKVRGSLFGSSFLALEGKVCRFSGQGMKAKVYRGSVDLDLSAKANIEILSRTAAPASAAPTAPAPRPQQSAPAAASETPAEHEVYFHREMRKAALLSCHAIQYAHDVIDRSGVENISPDSEVFRMIYNSMFMTAKERGLMDSPPKLRLVDDATGKILPFKPAPVDEEAQKRAAEEAAKAAAEEAARKAAEAAKREAEEAQKRAAMSEDVPF